MVRAWRFSRIPILSVVSLTVAGLIACADNADAPTGTASLDGNSQVAELCFRNEFLSGETRDVEELVLTIENGQASGAYNWLPAFKDRRVGELHGTANGGLVEAVYDYAQEGTTGSARITIRIEADSATVEGGPTELGLNRTLARVDC